MIVLNVVQQHVDDAAALASNRIALVDAPSATLVRLQRFDRRLTANLQGISLAGAPAWALCEAALEVPSRGRVFAAVVSLPQEHHDAKLANVLSLTRGVS